MANPRDSLDVTRPERAVESHMQTLDGMRSACPSMHRFFAQLLDLARSDAPVLIQGESGTGKLRAAQALHRSSLRRSRPLITLVCTARSAAQLDALLCGPAAASKGPADSPLLQARGGTLVLRDLTALDLAAQGVLLRALQDEPSLERAVPQARKRVRLVCTAAPDLPKQVRQGRFRAELYHRLVAARLHLPPLRERRPDIALLAKEALQQAARERGHPPPRLDAHAVELLAGYGWPGNVRELFNVMEQALGRLHGRAELRPADLTDLLYAVEPVAPVEVPIGSTLAEAERQFILQTLAAHQGRRQAAADTLKISRRTLYAKLAAYKRQGLDPQVLGGSRPDGMRPACTPLKEPGEDGALGRSKANNRVQRTQPTEAGSTP